MPATKSSPPEMSGPPVAKFAAPAGDRRPPAGDAVVPPVGPILTRPRQAGVLVTGSHRSGTTWVGQMLATDPELCYLHEPFKPGWDPPYVWTRFKDYFTYVTDENAPLYEKQVARTLGLHFSWKRHFDYAPSLSQAVGATRRWARWTARRLRGRRPLVKDPIALFSAPWLARRFGLGVVVMIRHPAAFVSSIKVKKWHFDFNHWLRQDLLMRDLLAPFEADLRAAAAGPGEDLVEQAILQWRVFHHVIHEFEQRHADWHFVRHEDLSLDPVAGYRRLFAGLGLSFTPDCERMIRECTDKANLKDAALAGKSTHFTKLDSAENVKNWQRRLSPDEILRVRRGTEDVSPFYYTDADWA